MNDTRGGGMSADNYTPVRTREDLTEEILDAAVEVYVGFFSDQRQIDWTDFIDRLDGMDLADGTKADFGGDMMSPAIEGIKAHIRRYRKETS